MTDILFLTLKKKVQVVFLPVRGLQVLDTVILLHIGKSFLVKIQSIYGNTTTVVIFDSFA